jgi:molybdopterin molybdotransferase
MSFDRVIVLDWSAAGTPKLGKDSIWLAECTAATVTTLNIATRMEAEAHLKAQLTDALAQNQRVLLAADFAFGAPEGLARTLTGQDDALALWSWLAARINDTPRNQTNYRDVAAEMNRQFGGGGPFWGNGQKAETPDLPRNKPGLPPDLAEFRLAERVGRQDKMQPKSLWQLAGAGAVGAQSLTGIAMLHRLRAHFAGALGVWPLEDAQTPIVVAEAYLSFLKAHVDREVNKKGREPNEKKIIDEVQTRLHAQAYFALAQNGGLARLMDPDQPAQVLRREGWYLGAGRAADIRAAALPDLTPPRLRNDCFAMPQGVDWVPVDDALARLRDGLNCVTRTETLPLVQTLGRVLVQDAIARRSNPPLPNSAVDGFGFAHASLGPAPHNLPLVQGRAAAGQPFAGTVPPGHAIRILTGAVLPQGVGCVVLEEDCATDGLRVAFDGPIKPRSNTRRAGEDIAAGDLALWAGHRLRAPDLALLAAIGVQQVTVYKPLRIGVLSTGDEVVTQNAAPHQIYDANRPMLLALAHGWGAEAVDLGHLPDNPKTIAKALDKAATRVDVIVTSGGASAGDEDHVSRLLREAGTLSSWRIAMKPGRPLALALWQGVPVFGLPGNPVAAMVCALIFLRPAVGALSGQGWRAPQSYLLPAAFSKSKKAGRREYLRARIAPDGAVKTFESEGSGRITGLSWATGLVELPDQAVTVAPGDPVRFLPFSDLFT